MITRQQAIDLYGGVPALAAALGYASRHAVYMWPKDRVPREPYMRLRYELKPEAFDAAGNLLSGAPGALGAPAANDDTATRKGKRKRAA